VKPTARDSEVPPPGTAARALEGGRRIHLIAVCGVAMAALAGMLQRRGFEVSGSDDNVYPPMSTLLERWGIPVRQGYRAENLGDRPDLVVVGNTVSRGNPEVLALLGSGMPYVSLPQALGELFLEGRRSVVVAGTHGKSTSTAWLAWVLEQAGRDPSVMVGGRALDFDGNFKLGDGEAFVIEGDEYDTAFFDKGPKFLHYRPAAVLLTSIEFDHADIYRDLDHVKDSFRRLLEILAADAPLLVAADFPHALEVVAESGHRAETFGLGPDADWSAASLHDTGADSRFEILYRGRPEISAAVRAPGEINVRNALGVYALARALGLRGEEILPGLRSFRGVARRQELVGEYGGVVVIDDFAHHPTAVAGAIAAIRARYPGRRLWAVFEPRSNTSRRKVFQQQFVAAFTAAGRVVIGGVFRKQTDHVEECEQFSPEQLAADLGERGVEAWTAGTAAEIAARIAAEAAAGDVVLMMSNGSFGGLRDLLAEALGKRPEPA
jgi:UDP-N-acetylmuramate: L-alanyl-gamma-D-glutamyl-meso-diaminopimelate ligase